MNYISSIIRAHYGNCDRKKISKDLFSKEINGALEYGKVEILQNLITKYLEGYSESEILGEIQSQLGESYSRCNKIFGLYKMPTYDVERIIRECEEKRNEKQETI